MKVESIAECSPCVTNCILETWTFTNSADLDEMPHNAPFHQGLHIFGKTKWIFIERNTIQ